MSNVDIDLQVSTATSALRLRLPRRRPLLRSTSWAKPAVAAEGVAPAGAELGDLQQCSLRPAARGDVEQLLDAEQGCSCTGPTAVATERRHCLRLCLCERRYEDCDNETASQVDLDFCVYPPGFQRCCDFCASLCHCDASPDRLRFLRRARATATLRRSFCSAALLGVQLHQHGWTHHEEPWRGRGGGRRRGGGRTEEE